VQHININDLKAHPRNNEFFDDIVGEPWTVFLDSIRTSGVIEPVVITPSRIIVSGHQRVRACRELGIQTVLTDMRDYQNEDQILKDLIETNIRQRGVGNPNPIKLGRCIKELERIYGIQHGATSFQGNQHKEVSPNNSETPQVTQSDIAEQLGISVDTLNNYKKLTEMIPELEELVDTGIVTPTTARGIMKKLSPEEQERFVATLDTTKKITQKVVQEYIEQIKELKSAPPKVIDKTDYVKISLLSDRISRLQEKNSSLESEKKRLEHTIALNEEDARRYKKLKSDVEFLTKQKDDLGRQIDSATELAELTVQLQRVLERDLAPIKFKRCMEQLSSSNVAVNNLVEIIEQIDSWSAEMKNILNQKTSYSVVIDIE